MYLWWYFFSSKLLSVTPSNFGYPITTNPSELSVNKTNWENELGRHLVCYIYIYIYIHDTWYISLYFPFISRAYPWLPSLLIWFPSWRRFCCSAGVTSSESKKIRSVMRSFNIILNHLKGPNDKKAGGTAGIPKSSIFVGSSAINHALWGTPHFRKPPNERFMMMTTEKGGWNLLIYC